MTRTPAVAGMFYELEPEALVRNIQECFMSPLGPQRLPQTRPERLGELAGLVCPHAGYIYSGPAAAHAYAAIADDGLPDTIVLLGPNHYGAGAPIAISPQSAWSTPLGTLLRDDQTALEIVHRCDFAQEDDQPHMREHSIEVQLPFLQYIGGDQVKIVPISISHLNERDAVLAVSELGPAIAAALEGKSAIIIASTDLTHYETRERAQTLDSMAIEQILRMDPQSLLEIVYKKQITMCGALGTAIMLQAAKLLGASSAQKLAYYTSGDVTGDYSQVVGYGSLSINRP